jgi:hypothetical protein
MRDRDTVVRFDYQQHAVISVKRTLHNMRSAVTRYSSARSEFVEEVTPPDKSVT